MSRYTPSEIEPRWQHYWAEHKTFHAPNPGEDHPRAGLPKYYVLCMFPYPSGAGLHVGHPLSYTAVDIVARYKRMQGFNVLNPIGFDAFGLPAERAAVREGRHPAQITDENTANFKNQMRRIGFNFDWDRELSTCTPDYYTWTQWIFSKMYERGLAYLAEVPVNWCPAQGTVLANEEVVDGKYVETGDPVERRLMKQWMLRITAYAQRLLDDLDDLDWPEGVLEMQRQWIGRSEGAQVRFDVAPTHDGDEPDTSFIVFTTRPDTLFGVTWCVLAPEHPLVSTITTQAQRAAVDAYVEQASQRSDMERQLAAEKEKTGVFTGAYAINPVNGDRIPIWVADYVMMTYGTGAIMAVPAHDERDHAFATKFGLPIIQVITAPDDVDVQQAAYSGDGVAMNSGEFDGLDVTTFKKRITDWLVERGRGEAKVNYKLRDWLFSRQRYWGEPFPIVYTQDGQPHLVDSGDLPISLPHLDEYKPTADGQPPLARAEDWVHTTWQGQPATRETNTMPQWAGSCWYYLRYMDPHNDLAAWSTEAESYWGPVDLYIGGVEHAVLHLLYARFWHKVLYDLGLVSSKEPFKKLFNQGMITSYSYRSQVGRYYHPSEVEERQGEWFVKGMDTLVQTQVEKMSKSKKNTVDPLDIIDKYGADTMRIYLMFMGPLEQMKPWQTSGCDGVFRFLSRTWRLFIDEDTDEPRAFGQTPKAVHKALHLAIKEATDGIEALKFNTPVSRMMEFVNACKGTLPSQQTAEDFLRVLSPYAPHLTEELWHRLGHEDTLADEPWPGWDPAALIDDTVTIGVQVKGKMRAKVEIARDATKEEVLAAARAHPKVARWLEGTTPIKDIYVPGRLVNFVVR